MVDCYNTDARCQMPDETGSFHGSPWMHRKGMQKTRPSDVCLSVACLSVCVPVLSCLSDSRGCISECSQPVPATALFSACLCQDTHHHITVVIYFESRCLINSFFCLFVSLFFIHLPCRPSSSPARLVARSASRPSPPIHRRSRAQSPAIAPTRHPASTLHSQSLDHYTPQYPSRSSSHPHSYNLLLRQPSSASSSPTLTTTTTTSASTSTPSSPPSAAADSHSSTSISSYCLSGPLSTTASSIREGVIVSNSILNNAVNQSILAQSTDARDSRNSNNSAKHKRGLSVGTMSTNSPNTTASYQQPPLPPPPSYHIHQQQQQQQQQPYSSSAATRPLMNSQRNYPSSSPASPSSASNINHPSQMNTSFSSSVGSGEAIAVNAGRLSNGASSGLDSNNYDSRVVDPSSSSRATPSHHELSAGAGAGAGEPSSATVTPATSTSSTAAHSPHASGSPSYSRQNTHQHTSSTATASSFQGSGSGLAASTGTGAGAGTGASTGTGVGTVTGAQTAPSSRKHRHKVEANAPRPSTTVSPAPTPAMHWSRARVHGQIPPKELRAQTVNLVGESVYVFGGCDTKNCFNTLYIFDADTMHWSQPKTFGSIPPPCRAHSSTLVDNKRLYVFGGGDGPHYFNELYMLDTDTLTWTNPQTTGDRPCRRRAHTTCVYNNCIYVFGGGDGVQALNDTYKLDLAEMRWSEVKTTGQMPIARGYHTSNLIKSQFIVYGGSDGHECFSDIHVLDLETKEWVKIDINRALPRLSHTATQVGSYLFVVGGHDGSRYSCDVVMLNLVTWSWETRKVYGIPPAGRGYHASLLYDSRLFMFGGYDGQTVFDDIYILDLSTCAYLPQITDFQILLRRAEHEEEEEEEEDGDYERDASQLQ